MGETMMTTPKELQTYEELREQNIREREERFKQMGFDTFRKNLVKDLIKNSPNKRPRNFSNNLPTLTHAEKIVIFIKISKFFVRYSGDSANSK